MRTNVLLFTVILALASLLRGKDVTYSVGGKDYEGYFISAGSNTPFVLLIHDWDGITEYEKTRTQMLKEKGYTVFAADLFGKGVRPDKIEERRKLTGELYGNREKMRSLIVGALKKARSLGAQVDNGVALGYCFGGTAALELARSGEKLKGFAIFHGGLATPEGQDYSKIQGSIIVFHGGADKSVTPDHFISCAKQMEEAKVDHEMIIYGGADHAFSVIGGGRYQKEADEASWDRFLAYLDETVGK